MVSKSGLAASIGRYGLEVGTPGIKSVGPLAFGPEGILFVADNMGATIFAIDVGAIFDVETTHLFTGRTGLVHQAVMADLPNRAGAFSKRRGGRAARLARR